MNTQTIMPQNNKVSRNIIVYVFGRLISLFGTNIYNFAISLYILKTTGSAKLFSISLAIGMVTKVLFSSYAGILSDKIDRKKIIVSMDILSGVTLLLLVLFSHFDSIRIAYIFIATFLISLCSVFFDVSITASLPNVVDDKNLTKINSLNTAVSSITQIFSPIVGGIIFVIVDIRIFLLLDAITFIVSGITEIFLDFNVNQVENVQANIESTEDREDNQEKEDNKEKVHEFKVGINYLKENISIFRIVLLSTMLNFLIQFGIVIPIPYIINNVIGLSESRYGIIQSMFAVGMLIVGISLSVLPQKEKSFKKIMLGLSGFSIAAILMGLFIMPNMMTLSKDSYFYIYVCLTIIISISLPLINIPLFVNMQRIIPNEVRGRVFGVITTIAGAIAPLGMILSGVLIGIIPTFVLPISSGVILIILSVIVLKDKDIREL